MSHPLENIFPSALAAVPTVRPPATADGTTIDDKETAPPATSADAPIEVPTLRNALVPPVIAPKSTEPTILAIGITQSQSVI